MEFLSIEKVKNISSIGGGPIGGGWTAFFLSKGYNVKSYLHEPKEKEMFMKIVKTAWKSLKKLGLTKNASLNNLSVTSDLKKSLEGSHFVQESAPEILSVKQELFARLDNLSPQNVVIGSSSSAIPISKITQNLRGQY